MCKPPGYDISVFVLSQEDPFGNPFCVVVLAPGLCGHEALVHSFLVGGQEGKTLFITVY